MTEKLKQELNIKKSKNIVEDAQKNYKSVQTVLIVILFVNLLVAIVKVFVGTLINSASMTADGYHSLSDGMSNVIGIICIKFASKPEDKEHPYGHNKIEAISGLIIGGILFGVGCTVIKGAYYKFLNPTMPNITTSSLLVLVATLCINIIITYLENKKGKELNSTILISDANHTKSDIFISFGVLSSLIGVKLGLPAMIDPIVTVIVSVFIFYACWEVVKENVSVLIDTSNVDSVEIRNCVLQIARVREVHNIRSRGTKNKIYIDMHIHVDHDMTVLESHKVQHKIEEVIQQSIDQSATVIIHVEPFMENEEEIHSF